MKIAIMQPYFLPYIGYFQLINSVDKFVLYDNIQFSKKGWIQRNRILVNGKDEMFTIPLKKDSDFLDICDRVLAPDYIETNKKTLRKIESSYKKAPYFDMIFPLVSDCFLYKNHNNLFDYIFYSIKSIANYLEIKTEIIVSSGMSNVNHQLKNKDRVIDICNSFNTSSYINPIGGLELYDKSYFKKNGIDLYFIKSKPISYCQFSNEFVPWLSIIDVLMFNSVEQINNMLDDYELL